MVELFANSGDPDQMLHLIWVCTVLPIILSGGLQTTMGKSTCHNCSKQHFFFPRNIRLDISHELFVSQIKYSELNIQTL